MSSYYLELLLSSVKILVWCAVRCICRFMKGGGSLLFRRSWRISRLPNLSQTVLSISATVMYLFWLSDQVAFSVNFLVESQNPCSVNAELQLPRRCILQVYLVARTGIPRCLQVNAILVWRWFDVDIFFCSCSVCCLEIRRCFGILLNWSLACASCVKLCLCCSACCWLFYLVCYMCLGDW
jgi:hypothetical protein